MQKEITAVFRDFALQVLAEAHVDPNNPKAVKLAMLDHYEEIYHYCPKKFSHKVN